jgi:hypothetical protein
MTDRCLIPFWPSDDRRAKQGRIVVRRDCGGSYHLAVTLARRSFHHVNTWNPDMSPQIFVALA